MSLPFPVRIILLGSCLITLGLADTASREADTARFMAEVSNHFATWDTDHDGALSAAELDSRVGARGVTGDEAAAMAALKRASRKPRYKLLPLTLENLRQMAEHPSKDQPHFGEMFRYGVDKIAGIHHVLFVADTPRLETIHQGKLGNCFSLAPLGAMTAGRPEAVKAMFHALPEDLYEVVLGSQTVRVALPTDAEIAMTSSSEGDGMWVNLYEKALGQARNDLKPEEERRGSAIDALAKGGSAGTILAFITGHEIVRFSCKFAKDDKITPKEFEAKLQELRAMLVSAQNEKRLMTCGTLKTTTPGLTPNHAYAILGYNVQSDCIRVWNPHGSQFVPKGDPGRDHGYPQNHGVLEVPTAEFVKQFSGLAFEVLPKQ